MDGENVLTCVYCGQAYPAGTPASGQDVKVLTDHIKVCEKHPMRAAEAKIAKLRAALIGLTGESDPAGLKKMEAFLRSVPAPSTEIGPAINAIHALLETME